MRMHPFKPQGIRSFMESALNEAMDNDAPLIITIGGHTIRVPMFPETYESMDEMLAETLNIVTEEVSE